MAGKTSREWASNGHSPRPVEPEREGTWASPPSGSRADRRVPVAAPDGAEVWLTPPSIDQTVGADAVEIPADGQLEREAATPVPETVEWIEIVEDRQRDVVEEVVAPETEPSEPQRDGASEAPASEPGSVVALAPAALREVDAADELVAVDAALWISLEPERPGNVHVYDITIDARDGTFIGVAARSSNVPDETIRGVFGDGFADIDFIAVYPGPAHQYAWFGSGPLQGFTASDSRGNVFHTASAGVRNLAYVVDDLPIDEPAALLPAVSAVESHVDEPWFDMDLTTDEPHDDAATEPDVVLEVDEPIEPDEPIDAEPVVQEIEVVTDIAPEETPELAVADVAVETPADDDRDHPASCRCLACTSAAFEPVPVTEGPLAGKAFYFRAQDVPDPKRSPGTETEHDAIERV